MNEDATEREPGDAAQPPKLDRAALGALAPDAKQAFETLRRRPRPRRTATGREACEPITVRLKVVTPILGGGPKLRQLVDIDIIRAPTVRGHLRFWWRALYGHLYEDAAALYAAESALWGRPADDNGGRSEVDVSITSLSPHRQQDIDRSNPLEDRATAYAVWPARVQGADAHGHLPRRRAGTVTFALRVVGPKSCEQVLRNVIRAWILFGGYGGRTRRGLGSLTVDDTESERMTWLPNLFGGSSTKEAADELASNLFGMRHFKGNILRPEHNRTGRELSQLANALLYADLSSATEEAPGSDAVSAWATALGWLRAFRQDDRVGARRAGRGRPGQSNWPEADKIRHHYGNAFAHRARPAHGPAMAWPRAGFGLPIVGEIRGPNEPGTFTLRWRSQHGQHDRLASPLILKPLPLANGNFLPCAVWLDRGLPDGAVVGLEHGTIENGRTVKVVKAGTEAPFHRTAIGPDDNPLLAPDDRPLFPPLSGKATLRDAFCDWLVASKLADRIAT